jgi:sugar transferase (PEP-CTERM/EpsH1 system associated)
MEPILFLTHRIPFPPTKGDKVRSFHLLKFLASRYRVHLGTFIDDPADRVHVSRLGEYCASFKVVEINPKLARIRSLTGFWTGEPLTLSFYRDAELGAWVRNVVRVQGISRAVVFSSAMAQYVAAIDGLRVIVDFVDVDSAKWDLFARTRPWPMSAVFAREGRLLLEFERAVAKRTDASVFVTPGEAELFRKLAPESAARVSHANMGVDSDFFSPHQELPNPYAAGEEAIVFTGAMDYWPNIDAVCWFAQESLPAIVAERPRARFYIVGMNPVPAVQALASDPRIVVTGRVQDVRPYLRHARVVIAPIRIARGIQSKVLEAMAMARPVVVSAVAAAAISGKAGLDYEVADSAHEFAQKTIDLLNNSHGVAIGRSARDRILADYRWTTSLAPFADLLSSSDIAGVTTR